MASDTGNPWEFWIDVGGTFTDCLARSPDGILRRHKTLSSGVVKGQVTERLLATSFRDRQRMGDPDAFWVGWTCHRLDRSGARTESRVVTEFCAEHGELCFGEPFAQPLESGDYYELDAELDAPLVAIRRILACPLADPLPPLLVRLGTTRGTNALLTRRGAKVAWVTTQGLGDLLRIGYQARPELFRLAIEKPAPLFTATAEVHERLAADGSVLEPLDEQHALATLRALKAAGIESLAIGLLHAYRNPLHERRLAELARAAGFTAISMSHEVAPLIQLVARGYTTVVDAYLDPILQTYLQRIRQALGDHPATQLRLMTSSGGLVSSVSFHGKDSILSGPAGGAIGCGQVALATGFTKAIGFDMGGTSTDVVRFSQGFDYEFETEKAGVRMVTPMLAIETVAAGGGSICTFDGVKLTVGPQSAGADPGPACYGRGGPLTVTDLNLLVGRLPADSLPFPLDVAAAEGRLEQLRQEVFLGSGHNYAPTELAEGLLRIANANMAQAIRSISVAKGYDPREYLLVAFGGAALQHACQVAELLGIRRVLDHPDASLLSALGIGLANITRQQQRGVYRLWTDVQPELAELLAEVTAAACAAVCQEGVTADRVRSKRSVELRYVGTDGSLSVPEPADGDFVRQFAADHLRLYGYLHANRPLEVVTVRAEAIGDVADELPRSTPCPRRLATSTETTTLTLQGQPHAVPRYRRDALRPGDQIVGPCLVIHDSSTTVVDDGWTASMLTQGELLLEQAAEPNRDVVSAEWDPIMLEIFHGHFETIARQMGITLRNTSSSVNVKERLDFSCALFTRDGELVVNAPHIPVHLGAMSETVKGVLADHPELSPGDVVVTNDPFRGGSHLPDITVVTPVFAETGRALRFLVASRAHHAEIGGVTPGSMPPFSTCLAEEGVLLRSFLLVRGGEPNWEGLRGLLTTGRYPSRDVESNLADIAAQMAANQQGVRDLHALEAAYGWETVSAYMGHIQLAAERKTRAMLRAMPDGDYSFHDGLDEGAAICVTIRKRGDEAEFDFSGSAPVQPNNLNANRAIVTAAVLYCLRCLVDQPIPLNQGVLAPIRLTLPDGMLNPPATPDPATCPAVAGGNVETSQRIVDCILGALQAAAASQGTMNNVLFGNSRFGYYETICGGAGATPHASGADAVQTHMTNTRLTDPEILESKYPVRLLEFSIRTDSAGQGQHPGGQGVVRSFQFLAPLDVSLLTQRRAALPPFGLAGGSAGALGENWLQRAGALPERLPGRAQVRVDAGDQLTIKTPGGGGWGPPDTPPRTAR